MLQPGNNQQRKILFQVWSIKKILDLDKDFYRLVPERTYPYCGGGRVTLAEASMGHFKVLIKS